MVLKPPVDSPFQTGSEVINPESRVSFRDGKLSSQESSNILDEDIQSNGTNSQWESSRPMTEPLSGKPFFSCILARANVDCQFQLVIPKSFYAELPAATLPVVLSCGNKSWAVSYLGDCKQRRFDSRWRNFAVDNHLKVGDACIFELMDSGKSLKFKVQILDGSIPSFVAALDDGSSSNSPITID